MQSTIKNTIDFTVSGNQDIEPQMTNVGSTQNGNQSRQKNVTVQNVNAASGWHATTNNMTSIEARETAQNGSQFIKLVLKEASEIEDSYVEDDIKVVNEGEDDLMDTPSARRVGESFFHASNVQKEPKLKMK